MKGFSARLLYTAFLVMFTISAALSVNYDSLFTVLKQSQVDTIKLSTLFKITDRLKFSRPDSALPYIDQELALAQKITTDSLLAKTFLEYGIAYWNKGEIKTADEYFRKALKISEKMNNNQYIISCLYNLSNVQTTQGKYSAALIYLNKVLGKLSEINDSVKIAKTHSAIGNIYLYQGIYTNALNEYLTSARILERNISNTDLALAYNNIGIIYYYQKFYEKSLEFYHKALTIKEAIKDKKGMSDCYNNIAIIYDEIDKYDDALKYYNKALDCLKELNNVQAMASVFANIGELKVKQKRSAEALTYFEQAIDLQLKAGDKRGLTYSYNGIGRTYNLLNQNEKAIDYLKKAVALAVEINAKLELTHAEGNLSDVYYEMGEYRKSYDYLKHVMKVKEEIYNEENSSKLNEMQARFETESMEKEIQILKQGKKLKDLEVKQQEAEVNKQRTIVTFLSVGLVLFLVFTILVVWLYFGKRKANKILARQKDELGKLSIVARETINSVVIFDSEGKPVWVNEGFVRMNGFDLEEFLKRVGSNIKEMNIGPDIKKTIQSCFDTKKPVTYSLPIITGYNTRIWIQTTLTPILDENKNISRIIAIDTDISRIKEAEEEIQQQKEELQAQSELLATTNKSLEKKNNQITDSINYARKIQLALLPDKDTLSSSFSDSFVLYLPKHIVSGDFYWFSKVNGINILAVVDCTGHGVPGAFMSLIGNTLLNEIIISKQIKSPAEILKHLNHGIHDALKQKSNETGDDGMEISICSIDLNSNSIKVASANQSLIIIQNNEPIIFEGDIFSVGGIFSLSPDENFRETELKAEPGTKLYLYTDGFQDQIGGTEKGHGKKYGTGKFTSLINNLQNEKMAEQKNRMSAELKSWMGNHEQIDDICVVGIRI